ncbi:hypothetical protein PPERSA_06484 [Pseudocohnilembus persalinus]|uniref:JmjC domain-containing protein n=1 Tax=Pseudocohnilembus persalinus TaxID=266149 RepID=A0A0V0QRB4_PSEPJ|nr:hypothetical protein PPERSA_06484 [Pseudocohnilembus persalinus]|eukprot:KRX04850.1 hypothetical protein PPERSA_06484 [Pseudocohnilembus persalinus]
MENIVQIEECPILKPSMKEFSNFEEYVTKLENKYSKDYGMVKVVAPRCWRPRNKDYEKSIENCNIPNPIEQNCFGKGGIYEVLHIIKKSMQMKDYIKKSQHFDKITKDKKPEDLEQLFWKNISFSPPLYGADFQYTLFDKEVCWNTSDLQDLLKKGTNGVIAGVNTPYLYVGQWKSLFAWHTEDMNLGALNYLHHGDPKFWYSVAQPDGHKLEKMAKQFFADNFGKCSEFLRHKTTVINPYLLKKKFPELKITKCVHRPREFMVVFNGAYHCGFNLGFNIAESVNFATANWLDHFLNAESCRCENTQVKIDKFEFYNNVTSQYPEYKENPKFKKFYKEISQYLQPKQQSPQSPIWDENTATTNDESLDKEKVQLGKKAPLIQNKKIKKQSKKVTNKQTKKQQQVKSKNNNQKQQIQTKKQQASQQQYRKNSAQQQKNNQNNMIELEN